MTGNPTQPGKAQSSDRKIRDAGSRPDELVTRRIAPSEITKRGAQESESDECDEFGDEISSDQFDIHNEVFGD